MFLSRLFFGTPAPEEPFQLPEGSLRKWHHHFVEIQKEENPKRRTHLLRQIGRQIISQGKSWSVDWRQFALMHNASVIRYTDLEGGELDSSVEAWHYFLSMWEKGEGLFFTLGLTKHQFSALFSALDDLKFFHSYLPGPKLNVLTDEEVYQLAEEFQGALSQRLHTQKAVYLPLGYRHGIGNEGHAIACKIEYDQDGFLLCHLMNLGNGSEHHPVLNYTMTQDKISFRYFPFVVQEKNMWGELGLIAFCHLIRYLTDPPNPNHAHYDGEDLLDIFYLLGEVAPYLGEHPEQFEAKNQRVGNCSEKGVHNVVHDVLIGTEATKEEIKSLFLNIKFGSLVAGYHAYRRSPTEKNRFLLNNAVQEVGIALQKMKTQIRQDEYLAASAIIAAVEKEVRKPSVPVIHQITQDKVPPITNCQVAFAPIDQQKIADIRPVTLTMTTSAQNKRVPPFFSPHFEITTFAADLDLWIKHMKALTPSKAYLFLEMCAAVLPIPKWEKSDPWDQVARAEALSIISKLEKLVKLGLKDNNISNKCGNFIPLIVTIHTFYVIVDRLARKSPSSKLEGFSSPFVPHIQNYHPKDFTVIFLGRENQRYSQISLYFTKSAEETKRNIIFPVEPVLSIEQYIYESTHGGEWSQGTNHVRFLQRHAHSTSLWTSLYSSKSLYSKIWLEMETMLPAEVNTLYYFAFISSTIFYSEQGHSHPLTLNFEKGFDQNGKEALLIQCDIPKTFSHHPVERTRNGYPSPLWFYQFKHMAKRDGSAIPLSDPYFERMRTNDAVCARLSEKQAEHYKIAEPIYRDLLRITRKRNLTLPMAIHWASMNEIHLGHGGIQDVLQQCFFAPCLAYHQLSEEPLYIDTIRDMVIKGLDYYRDNPHHFKTILFLLEAGIFFETHAHALMGPRKSGPSFRFYQQKLENLMRFELKKEPLDQLKVYWILIQTHRIDQTEEELFVTFKTLFNFEQLELPYDWWLRDRKQELLQTIALQIRDRLESDLDFRNSLCHAIFQDLLPEVELKTAKWSGSFPIFHIENYQIDLMEGRLSHSEQGALTGPDLTWCPEVWKTLMKQEGGKFWKANDQYHLQNLNGNLRIQSVDKRQVFERLIEWRGEKRWARIYEYTGWSALEAENLNFLNDDDCVPLVHYRFLDRKKDDPDLISYDFNLDIPVLRIDYAHDKMSITRVDRDGNRLPIHAVNLNHITDPNDPLRRYVLRFSHPGHILCFVNTKTKEIEELNFYRLKLQFKNTAQGLESTQNPGYYLQITETLGEMDHFPGALILQNNRGERKAILPVFELKATAVDFRKVIEIQQQFANYHHKCFMFEIDPIDGTLSNSQIEANFYLALILRMQGNELKALRYIRKVKLTNFIKENQMRFLLKFTKIKDHSPTAIAFNAQLFSWINDNFSAMLEGKFAANTEQKHLVSPRLHRELFQWGRRIYSDYLKAISRDQLSAIPKDLRLTLEEEKAILRSFKAEFEKVKKEHPEIKEEFPYQLALRYKLLCTQKQSVIATITPKDIPMRYPAINLLIPPKELRSLLLISRTKFPYGVNRRKEVKPWDDLTFPIYPNRISYEAIEAEFPKLYIKARKCQPKVPHPFDYTLLACLKIPKNDNFDGQKLANLLFYVRHFPHHFAHLTFSSASSDAEKSALFIQIVKQAMKLEESWEYKEFAEKYLKETAKFDFSRKTRLTLKKPDRPLLDQQRPDSTEAMPRSPFSSLGQKLFKRTVKTLSLPQNPPFMNSQLAAPPLGLGAEIDTRFQRGYEDLKKRETTHYHLIRVELPSVEKALESKQEKLLLEIRQLRQQLIDLTNKTYKIHQGSLTEGALHGELEYRLKRTTHQNLTILPETIMKMVVLTQNPQFLRDRCPLLCEDEIQEIMHQVCTYYYLLTCYQVCKESLLLIEKLKMNEKDADAIADLGALLHYQFLDPWAYPEVFYFKVTEGKLPRPEQATIYTWVCNHLAQQKKVCYQHKAGGGKTDYLSPLLMLRAKRLGLMPIFLSTQMMYAVDKDNLSATLVKLDHQLSYLELGMHMKLSTEDFQGIFEQLQQYHKEGRGLIMTPQTYYMLRLQYHYAGIKEKSAPRVQAIGNILHFFETNSILLGDETHANFNPLTRAIFGVGDFTSLPKEEQLLFVEMLKPLLGYETVYCEDGQRLSTVAHMEKNLIGMPTPDEIKLIQKTIAHHMSQSKTLDIPAANQKEIYAYWTDPTSTEPLYLKRLATRDHQKASLIALTGYFISSIIPQIVSLRTELDHGRSIFAEEEFDTPCHHKTPSTAQYEDSYLAASLSIKGTAHRALLETQMRKLIIKMLEQDWKEQKELATLNTLAARRFREWVVNTSFDGTNLRDISISNPEQMERLTKVLGKHPAVIEHYLINTILPQIGYCMEQLICTPAHLLSGFKQAVLFTATPLGPIYPLDLAHIRYDSIFEAEVVTEFCKQKNQRKIYVESPETFFEEVQEQYSKELREAAVYLDPNGFFCDFPNDQLAKQWLLASPQFDGVLYFKEGRSLNVNKEEKICLRLRDGLSAPGQRLQKEDETKDRLPNNTIELVGSNIREALSAHKLKWEDLTLGTYHDASHTESANIVQKRGTTAFIFVGDHLTLSRLIQALLRLRGFLDKKMVQNIIWVFPKEVAKKIPCGSSGEIDGAAIYAWCRNNEAEAVEKQIMLNAFQEIDFQVERPAAQALNSYLDLPRIQMQIMQSHQQGLLETRKHDPYASFAQHEKWRKTPKVLMAYAKTQYEKYGYATSLEESSALTPIQQITQRTEKTMQKIPTQWAGQISLNVEQQIRLKKDNEQLDFRPRPFDPISAEGIYGSFSCTDPAYPDFPFISGHRAFSTTGLCKKLFFEQNQLRTAKNAGNSMETSYLKPIDFFMIIIKKDGTWYAVAHSNEILSAHLENLIKGTDDPDVKHQIFIVSAEGKLIQRGKKNLEPSESTIKTILESQEMQDLVIDAALLHGQISHPDRLLKRIKKWEKFADFWKGVADAQPNPEIANRTGVAKLMGSCGK